MSHTRNLGMRIDMIATDPELARAARHDMDRPPRTISAAAIQLTIARAT
jgi:exonuclease III